MKRGIFRDMILGAAMVVCLAATAFAVDAPVLQVQTAAPGATVEVDRVSGDSKVIVGVVDEKGSALLGLGAPDFSVSLGGRTAKVISSQPLSENLDIPRHIVLVLDNSDSMRQRDAIGALLSGVSEVLKIVRPIDDVRIVTFAGKKTMFIGGRNLHVQVFKSNKPVELQAYADKVYRDGITSGTVLYEAMLAGLEIIRNMPENDPRFLVIFSDGEDLNSSFKQPDVLKAAKGIKRFNAYAIDYLPGKQTDSFLTSFAKANHGQVLKADSEKSLVPIFQSVASKMQYYYVITYAFPLTGKMAVLPNTLTIEEVKTIDSSPMLGQVYFGEASSEIPAAYACFAGPADTAGFDEQKYRDTLEKYYQVLNIIGKRLADKPEAKITLVGCNSDTGKEKGKKALSAKRAEAVKDYLKTVWGIAPERMSIEARNMPSVPSAKWQVGGQAENRRVEIRAADPATIAPIRSVYEAMKLDAPALTVQLNDITAADITGWKLIAANTAGTLAEQSGTGSPTLEQQIALPTADLKALAAGGDIRVKMELKDKNGQRLELTPDPVKVAYIQTSQRVAEKKDLKVQEKYALILFDFDKDTVGGLNQMIVDKVAERILKLPEATVEIVGHTDNMGKEAYNLKLSERRAKAVGSMLVAACGKEAAKRIRSSGVGPKNPLYDNATPEARAFNRTVTITLEYMSAEQP